MPFDPSILFVQFVSGLSRAMILFLMASGLTLVFGVMNVINFAHGAFYMIGAYMAFTLTQYLTGPLGFWVTLLIAPTIVCIVGGIVEVTLLRRIYKKEHLLQILLTYALIFVFNDLIKIIWGVDLRIVNLPKSLQGFVRFFGHRFPVYYFFIIGVGTAVAILLWLLLKKTRFGKVLRASAEHRDMVGLLGYNVGGLFTLVFVLATWLGGLSGAVIAPTVRLSLGMGTYNALSANLYQAAGFEPPDRKANSGLSDTPTGGLVSMVGYFGPLVDKLTAQDCEVLVLERAPERVPERRGVSVTCDPQDLAGCKHLLCTASTLINDSLEDVLAVTEPPARIEIVGPSGSGLPDPLLARGVTSIGGVSFSDREQLIAHLRGGGSWGEAGRKYQLDASSYPGLAQLTARLTGRCGDTGQS